jgi:Hemerythrin HHE cation binding domain
MRFIGSEEDMTPTTDSPNPLSADELRKLDGFWRAGIVAYDEARCRVLAEHEVLRVLIEQLRQAAFLVQRGGCAQQLRDTGRTLCVVLEAHAVREEGLLRKSFVSVESRRRLEQMHDRQAHALAELRRGQGCGPLRYAATAAQLAPGLLAVLELEEYELFEGQAPARIDQAIPPR